MKRLLLLVEGGEPMGVDPALREGLSVFLSPLADELQQIGWQLDISPSGSRWRAVKEFRLASKTQMADCVVLLIDAEGDVQKSPLEHLKLEGEKAKHDWDIAKIAVDEQCYYMCQCVETWFAADLDKLAECYGAGFERDRLVGDVPLENWSVDTLDLQMRAATRNSVMGTYHKRNHAPFIFRLIRAEIVRQLPHCFRFLEALPKFVASL